MDVNPICNAPLLFQISPKLTANFVRQKLWPTWPQPEDRQKRIKKIGAKLAPIYEALKSLQMKTVTAPGWRGRRKKKQAQVERQLADRSETDLLAKVAQLRAAMLIYGNSSGGTQNDADRTST